MPMDSIPIEGPPIEDVPPGELPPPPEATVQAETSSETTDDIEVASAAKAVSPIAGVITPVVNLDDDPLESSVEKANLETEADGRQARQATAAGFVLPDGFELPSDSQMESVGRE